MLYGVATAMSSASSPQGTEGKYYILSTDGSTYGFFYQVEGGATIQSAAYKAYLYTTTAQAGSKGFVFSLGNATAINKVNANGKVVGKVYDMQGRLLNAVPEKGLYIQNGKVYMK